MSEKPKPLPLLTILESNGLDDCLRSLRTRPDLDWLWRLYCVDCAREVQHLMPDQRSIDLLDVAERYALGMANIKELATAQNAALEAARIVTWEATQDSEWEAAQAAARATAQNAAWEVARNKALAAAGAAARAAALAAAGATARAAAWEAAREKQKRQLRRMLETGERPDWKEAVDPACNF